MYAIRSYYEQDGPALEELRDHVLQPVARDRVESSPAIWMSMIDFMCSSPSAWKKTISSTRLRNSGRSNFV